jgi:protein disulfide-isomerase
VQAAINQGYVPVKIHTGRNKNLVEMFGIKSIPTDVIVTSGGDVVSQGTSKQAPTDFVNVLTKGLASVQQIAAKKSVPDSALTAAQVASNAVPKQTVPNTSPMVPSVASAHASSGPLPVRVASNITGSFVMPERNGGGVPAQLAGVRTEGMSLSIPEQIVDALPTPSGEMTSESAVGNAAAPLTVGEKTTKQQEKTVPSRAAEHRELAIEGYCPVALIEDTKWAEGNPALGVVHLGKLYLFSSETAMQKFLSDPAPYTPVLNEIDVVRFFEEKQIVPGKRTHGTTVNNRMFFFADEEALEHFNANWERYFDSALQVMEQAVKEANPGS